MGGGPIPHLAPGGRSRRRIRFAARPSGQHLAMVSLIPRLINPRSLLNPISRVALMTFAWSHRHEILRWGRTLYDQLVARSDVSPVQAVRTGLLLFSIASDDELRNAKQLRKVTMSGGHVDVDVDERWSQLPRLIDRICAVKGVRRLTVNGAEVAVASGRIVDTTARSSAS